MSQPDTPDMTLLHIADIGADLASCDYYTREEVKKDSRWHETKAALDSYYLHLALEATGEDESVDTGSIEFRDIKIGKNAERQRIREALVSAFKEGSKVADSTKHSDSEQPKDTKSVTVVSAKQMEDLRSIHKIQGEHGNWDYSPYMQGMYNGMEIMLATVEDRVPVFKQAPETWIADIAVTTATDTEAEATPDVLQNAKKESPIKGKGE